MRTYINNLLPRLREHSETLDKKELLVDQPWVLVDEEGNKQQYIFERDGNLIMSLNGDTKYGKWRYLPSAKSLLIDRENDSLLLNHAFFSKGVCVLKKDGFIDQPWMLVNQNVVPDLDIERYLNALLPENRQYRELKLENGTVLYFSNSNTVYHDAERPLVGSRVKDLAYSQTQLTGVFKCLSGFYYRIEVGVVTRVFVKERVKTHNGFLVVSRDTGGRIEKGDPVECEDGSIITDGVYKLEAHDTLKQLEVKDGRVIKVWGSNEWVPYAIALLTILFLLILWNSLLSR